jgi:hypothetical protein
MVSHDPAVSISPMDSTHPSLPLYIVRTSHVIPSPLTTMSVFRLGSCSSLPAISSADTTFSIPNSTVSRNIRLYQETSALWTAFARAGLSICLVTPREMDRALMDVERLVMIRSVGRSGSEHESGKARVGLNGGKVGGMDRENGRVEVREF